MALFGKNALKNRGKIDNAVSEAFRRIVARDACV
jgi:hypothetical protein